ncbi:hypothetical protein URH17368_1593 [Alicyclobacillus hesperidum URH17-3-68]|nr:hypothetical protein URH17368_1593 [Alicyclobacillus hesperidum URH17-3-68]
MTQAAKNVTMLFAAVMAALILPNYALWGSSKMSWVTNIF